MAGLAASFGSGAMTNSIAELENADCILVIGSNTTSSHPLIAMRIFRAKQKGARLIVADPRRIQLALMADLHVRHNLGTDVALINAMMHVIIKEGWHNQAFIDERTEGFEDLKKILDAYTPEKAAEITGVAADDIIRMAEYYAKAKAGSIVYCMGITQHTTGVDNVRTLANLSMITGHIGRESTGVNPLRGQNNVQGACDMGGLPNVYPAYQAVTDPDNKKKFESAWNAALSDKVGLTVSEMMSGLSHGPLKALYILGENPMVSDPDTAHVEKALKSAELLVVQDIFLTETARLAHVVLPGATFAEKDGTFSNTERRVMRVRKAIDPVGNAKADWEIIKEISNRFGYPMEYGTPEEIMKEISSVTPSYGGITYQRLDGEGLLWPCPTTDHPGTKFLHKDKFVRGKGLFYAVEFKPPAEVVDEEFPFWFTTGRVFAHYHTGTMTRNCPTLDSEIHEGFLEVNPGDAEGLGLRHGDAVNISSRRGLMTAKTMVTDRVTKGVVFMPFHFAESSANVLTNTVLDPVCKIPELKVCAVRLEKVA
ncbi:Formate dehydrogenase subunit alpha [uncultured Desulfobacterium sp.]|uniref:nitrate reductase (cytochrome) n=1 Tax=uncultured Desulfobacterium sp. TaxID=201089 RepID=A0A445N3J8_9BACT|nr:Formate dehydrogenase subunit alpha [uncultured Desulfobacterium sp.]